MDRRTDYVPCSVARREDKAVARAEGEAVDLEDRLAGTDTEGEIGKGRG